MQVTRKKEAFASNNSNKSPHILYNFDYNTLSLFVAFLLCDSKEIKRNDFIRLRDLVSLMDRSAYKADPKREKLLEMVDKGIEARVDKRLNNKQLILAHMKGGLLESTEAEGLDEFSNLTKSEIEYVNDCISNALNCAVMQNEMQELKRLTTEYDMGDYASKAAMTHSVEDCVGRLHNNFKRNRPEEDDGNSFSFAKETLKDKIYDLYDKLTEPGRFLQTQMQGFNLMLGGGLESSRFYLLLGISGVGKSLTMLNLAIQIRNENRFYQPKDPTKKPTILFLTQENTTEETIDRLFKIVTNGQSIAKYNSKEEVYNALVNEGHMEINDEYNIDIDVIYRPDRSINTADLRDMIDELAANGKEVICIFQDHIKRIRSVENISDTRLELGAVVNEMKSIGIEYQLPVISVSHLNRDASNIVETGSNSNAVDLTRQLGRSNVGESMLMIDNSDGVIIIGREMDGEGVEYIAFNLDKLRYAPIKLDYMLYPLDGLKLETDTDKYTPIYLNSLRPENNPINGLSAYTQNNSSIFSNNQTFKSMDDLASEDGFGISSEDFGEPVMSADSLAIDVSKPEVIDLVKWAS